MVKMEAIENKKTDLFTVFSTGLFDDYVDSHFKESFKVEPNIWNEISKFVKWKIELDQLYAEFQAFSQGSTASSQGTPTSNGLSATVLSKSTSSATIPIISLSPNTIESTKKKEEKITYRIEASSKHDFYFKETIVKYICPWFKATNWISSS